MTKAKIISSHPLYPWFPHSPYQCRSSKHMESVDTFSFPKKTSYSILSSRIEIMSKMFVKSPCSSFLFFHKHFNSISTRTCWINENNCSCKQAFPRSLFKSGGVLPLISSSVNRCRAAKERRATLRIRSHASR